MALGAALGGPQQLAVVGLVDVGAEQVQGGQGDRAFGDTLEDHGEASGKARGRDAAVGSALEEAEVALTVGVQAGEATFEMEFAGLDVTEEGEESSDALVLLPDGVAGGVEQVGVGELLDVESRVHGRPPECGNPLIPLVFRATGGGVWTLRCEAFGRPVSSHDLRELIVAARHPSGPFGRR